MSFTTDPLDAFNAYCIDKARNLIEIVKRRHADDVFDERTADGAGIVVLCFAFTGSREAAEAHCWVIGSILCKNHFYPETSIKKMRKRALVPGSLQPADVYELTYKIVWDKSSNPAV